MNIRVAINQRPGALLLLLFFSLACAWPSFAAEESTPDEARRQRVAQLESKSRELKQAGKHEEARRVWEEAQDLRGSDGRERMREPVEGMEREMQELRMQIERRRAEGKDVEAGELKERLVELEKRFRADARERRTDMRGGASRPNSERGEGSSMGKGGPAGRERHLRIAVEHLHAAGLHDLAQRVERQAFSDTGRREGVRPREAGRVVMPSSQGLVPTQELRREIENLRRDLGDLRGQLEELRRDRR